MFQVSLKKTHQYPNPTVYWPLFAHQQRRPCTAKCASLWYTKKRGAAPEMLIRALQDVINAVHQEIEVFQVLATCLTIKKWATNTRP